MIQRPFEQWLFEDVELTFGIERSKNLAVFKEWLEVSAQVTTLPPEIEELRTSLFDNVEIWNEDELKMMFIAPFLLQFKFNNVPHYRVFSQRYMKLQTPEVEAAGRVEWMIATGKQRPRKPFFFMQEYKPEKNSGNDPLGQLLISMIDAQMLNETPEKPLYGCYTIGRLWFFVILQHNTYAVSRAYDATQSDDLSQMMVILAKVRHFIHEDLGLD